jgi:hypothetical protein
MTDNNINIPIHKPQTVNPIESEVISVKKPESFVTQKPVQAPNPFPSEVVDLPSQGYFYDESSPLSSGRIDLKFVTAKEEDILTSQNLLKKGVVIDKLLEALILTPGVKLDDILICDKNAIVIASRRLAYGDKYEAEIIDQQSGEKYNHTIDLSLLKNKEFDFSKYTRGSNKFLFELPNLKKAIEYRLLTHRDESNIDIEIKQLSKNNFDKPTPDITTRLKYQILSIDGNSDKNFIRKFVEEMPSRDSLALRQNIKENTPEVDMSYTITSPITGNTERITIPFGINFFWPSTGL